MDDILKRNEKDSTNPPISDYTESLSNDSDTEESKEFDISSIPPEDLDSRWLRWKCLVCGYLYEGVTRLKVCPKCGNQDPDKFEDAE